MTILDLQHKSALLHGPQFARSDLRPTIPIAHNAAHFILRIEKLNPVKFLEWQTVRPHAQDKQHQ